MSPETTGPWRSLVMRHMSESVMAALRTSDRRRSVVHRCAAAWLNRTNHNKSRERRGPGSGESLSCAIGVASRLRGGPRRAFQARDPDPRWVRTASETAGPQRARAVTTSMRELQVARPPPFLPRPPKQPRMGSNRSACPNMQITQIGRALYVPSIWHHNEQRRTLMGTPTPCLTCTSRNSRCFPARSEVLIHGASTQAASLQVLN